MPYENTNAAKLGSLQQFADSLAANAAELPHLEQTRLQYETMLGTLQETGKEQAALVASKQESSKRFRTQLTECQRLASVLRAAVKQHYGIRSEKLAEYNMQPFRGRKPSAKPRQRRAKKQPEPMPVQAQPASPEAQ